MRKITKEINKISNSIDKIEQRKDIYENQRKEPLFDGDMIFILSFFGMMMVFMIILFKF